MEHTAAISSTLIPFLLGLLGILWVLVASLGAFCFKRIFDRLDALVVHKEGCLTTFANKDSNAEDHAKLFSRTDEHDRRLTKLETQVESLRHERKA